MDTVVKPNWPVKKLGEVAEINPSKRDVLDLPPSTEVTFVPMSAVDEGSGAIVSPEVRKLGEVMGGYTYFAENDVLFAKITPCMENGKVAMAENLVNNLGFGSTEFHVLRAKQGIAPEWIYAYLRRDSFREEAEKHMTGTAGQKRVQKEYLENVPIPIPPHKTQKAIVERLDAIKKTQELNDEQISLAGELFESLLQKEIHYKRDWPIRRIGELARFINGYPFSPADWKTEGFPIIRIQNLNDKSKSYNYFPGKLEDKYLVKGGDILVSWSASLGVYLWSGGPAWLNQHIFKVIEDPKLVDHIYLYFALLTILEELKTKVHGGTMKHVTKRPFEETTIPTPSIEKQRMIAQKLSAVREYKKKLLKQKELLQELFSSTLAKAMKGELLK